MRYKNGTEINVGDHVLVEGNVRGTVVCDYDKRECLDGYDSWLTKEELVGGGTLSSGVMIETDELGFLHYPEDDDDILIISQSV
ncbi:MAG: hypothetical protein HY308_09445 [Gammaproteobacteria bacterium]|nr:hypothetical protein [Gammaproteobacteria bacterium]